MAPAVWVTSAAATSLDETPARSGGGCPTTSTRRRRGACASTPGRPSWPSWPFGAAGLVGTRPVLRKAPGPRSRLHRGWLHGDDVVELQPENAPQPGPSQQVQAGTGRPQQGHATTAAPTGTVRGQQRPGRSGRQAPDTAHVDHDPASAGSQVLQQEPAQCGDPLVELSVAEGDLSVDRHRHPPPPLDTRVRARAVHEASAPRWALSRRGSEERTQVSAPASRTSTTSAIGASPSTRASSPAPGNRERSLATVTGRGPRTSRTRAAGRASTPPTRRSSTERRPQAQSEGITCTGRGSGPSSTTSRSSGSAPGTR